MDNFFPEGSRVWLRENGHHYPSTVNSCAEGVVVFRTDYGQVFTYKQSTITHQKVTAMHPMNEEGVDDMATLAELHGGSIMHNLHQRYKKNQIYTYIGSIIASVNPYKTIGGLYEPSTMERYSKCHLGELPPHIFAVANECYRCLWRRQDSQCVLIRYLHTRPEREAQGPRQEENTDRAQAGPGKPVTLRNGSTGAGPAPHTVP